MRYYVIGSGGQARQVASIGHSQNPPLDIQGFVALNKNENWINGLKVIDETSFLKDNHTKKFLINGMGRPERKQVIEKYLKLGYNFATLIHPASSIGEFSIIGNGVIIQSGVNITTNVAIGNFDLLDLNSTVGHSVTIGDYTTISTGVNIAGGVQVGSGCWIGSGAVIIEDVKIGDNSIVGAGAVVTQDVEQSTLVLGVPAKFIRKIEDVSQTLKRK